MKVLVVDDIPDNVRLLTYDLEDAGYEVLTATNGREALQLLGEHGPQIILTDWVMPEMDGLELCQAIRSSECSGYVYIIMITAQTEKDRLVEAFLAGANDFLHKPFHHPELMARVKAGAHIVSLDAQLARNRRAVVKANAELAILNEDLTRLATTDELTGLGNRREAMRHLNDCWATASRHGQPIACMQLDVDHFKQYNDRYGHDVGDLVLSKIAASLQRHARAGERVFRLGGEEFLVVCPLATAEEAGQGADRLRKAIESETINHGKLALNPTISFGVAERSPNMDAPNRLLKLADDALYRAKEEGRNRVVITPTSTPQVQPTA